MSLPSEETGRASGLGDRPPGAVEALLLAALADGPQAVALFDPADRLAYANRMFREGWGVGLLDGSGAEPTFAAIVRACHANGVGAAIVTDDIEAWLGRAARMRRDGPPFRAFEVDLCDGRWFWITERRLDEGWILSVGQDITALKRNEKTLEAARDLAVSTAFTDPLTQLSNRRGAMERLASLFAAGQGFPFALVDIDHFKRINDSFGHAAGDAVLSAVARRLEVLNGWGCTVARLAGDEFAVIGPPGRDRDWFAALVRGFAADVAQPFAFGGHAFRTELSIGVAEAFRDGADTGALLASADAAMYEAKAGGRAALRVYEAWMGEARLAKAALGRALPQALANREFTPFYQPIVDLRTGLVRGLEALARWNHPVRGLLAPDAFADAFSDAELAVAIDDFMLEAALADMRVWAGQGLPVATVNVNASGAQLRRPDLIERVRGLLARYRLSPDRLKIEAVESAFFGRSEEQVAANIEALAAMGVVCVLDDFGTGFASLSHLRRFRVGRIKIDRAFVANLCTDPFDRGLVRSLVDLGRNLGLRITAEGVETAEQMALLRVFGCDCAQGFLIARPAPAAAVPALLMQWYARRDALSGSGEAPAGQDAPATAAFRNAP